MNRLPLILIIIISTLFINVASAETQHMTNFETIDKGTVSHYELSSQATTLEIYNHDDWSNFWKVHQHINASSNAPTRPLPEINFVHYYVLAAIDQPRGSGGYVLEIKAIEIDLKHENKPVNIVVESQQPGNIVSTISVITRPYHIIKIRK